ncbi:MAG: FG-GAP-like repeat-containing protein, partial [Verrucomicrobiota bacterium]
MPGRGVQLACLLLLPICLLGCKPQPPAPSNQPAERAAPAADFLRLMNAGKNYLDQGDGTNALAIYRQAEAIVPNDLDLRLNLANSCLLADLTDEALRQADEALRLEPNSAAAYFIKGCAFLRRAEFEPAAKALENVQKIEPGEAVTSFQLGRARMGLNQWNEAVTAFREGLSVDPNHLHASVHFLLGQSLLRAGKQAEAEQELVKHQSNLELGGGAVNTASFERSKFTQARVPFKLEQPDPEGIQVRWVDATATALGPAAERFSGPAAVIDPNQSGWNSLFVQERGQGFRLLWNTNGLFRPGPDLYPAVPGATYSKALAGDLQNDHITDVIVLGAEGSQLFKFETNGLVTAETSLGDAKAVDGALLDLDFTGQLDLVAVMADPTGVRLFRQFGPFRFSDITSTSGIPSSWPQAQKVVMEDWNRDGLMDVLVSRAGAAPLLLQKQRGGPLVAQELTNGASGTVFCTGDFDNDLRPDLAVVGGGQISLCFNGGSRKDFPLSGQASVDQIIAVDYDNDGWLDLCTVGSGLRFWRNRGLAGFRDETERLGLSQFAPGPIAAVHFADFDRDCDSDVIVA